MPNRNPLLILALLMLPLITACGEDGPLEEAADQVEEQMEGGTSETVEEAEEEGGAAAGGAEGE